MKGLGDHDIFDALVRYRAALAATPPAPLDVERRRAVLKFYAEQMPAYAVAAGLNRDEYAAVMVDVRWARAEYARLTREEGT